MDEDASAHHLVKRLEDLRRADLEDTRKPAPRRPAPQRQIKKNADLDVAAEDFIHSTYDIGTIFKVKLPGE